MLNCRIFDGAILKRLIEILNCRMI